QPKLSSQPTIRIPNPAEAFPTFVATLAEAKERASDAIEWLAKNPWSTGSGQGFGSGLPGSGATITRNPVPCDPIPATDPSAYLHLRQEITDLREKLAKSAQEARSASHDAHVKAEKIAELERGLESLNRKERLDYLSRHVGPLMAQRLLASEADAGILK